MGEGKFRPHSSHIFLPIFLKLKTKKQIRDTNPQAKFGKDRLGEHPNFGCTFGATLFIFLFFVLFAQRPGRTARPTVTNEGSKRVSGQGSAFWGF